MEEDDEVVEEYFSDDRAFPLIYDIYLDEEDLLEEVIYISVDYKIC
jgi:hypothetical protein